MESEDTNAKVMNTMIVVNVASAQFNNSINAFTYGINGRDQLGTFEIQRRYNDFFYLRESLIKKWPGLYIPPIPEKKFKGKNDEQTLEIRQTFFQFFLKQLSKAMHLFYSKETQQFLRNKSIQMEKFFSGLSDPVSSELINLYKKIFSELDFSGMSVGNNNNTAINFLIYLKKAEKQLKGMRDNMLQITIARDKFIENLNQCNNVLLPEYEKNVYSEYLSTDKNQNKLIFVQNYQVQDSIKDIKDNSKVNPYSYCLNMLGYEIKQVQAMLQALEWIETYQSIKRSLGEKRVSQQAQMSKLAGGKITFKSIFSKGSKVQQIKQLEKSIPQIQKQLQYVGEILSIIICVLGSVQIPKFKKNKQQNYYKMMENVSSTELKFLNAYGNHMKTVMQAIK